MAFEAIIERFGYWAILLGTALEGETILVVAGYLAHRGYLRLPYVIAAAMFGTIIGDQTFFQLGRQSGGAFLARHPNWQTRAARVQRLFNRHRIALVMGFRFMYGIRTVSPFVIGMSGFSRKLFLLLNVASAAIWAIVVGCGGYAFGHVLEKFLAEAKRIEIPVIISIIGIGIAVWIWHSRHVRRTTRRDPDVERLRVFRTWTRITEARRSPRKSAGGRSTSESTWNEPLRSAQASGCRERIMRRADGLGARSGMYWPEHLHARSREGQDVLLRGCPKDHLNLRPR